MSLITRMRRQNAIYWPPTVPDMWGAPGAGPLVELVRTPAGNVRVRWEDTHELFIAADGTNATSRAKVFVPLLPDGTEVVPGGWLWLGDRADLTDEATPNANEGAYRIQGFEKKPNLRVTEFVRIAML
jgi:hypothetical protein